MTIQCQWHRWQDLPPDTLYAFLKLRSDIFVVEQNCVFSDMDGIDSRCLHLCATDGDDLVGYLRIVPAGLKRPHTVADAAPGPMISRVVVAPAKRGLGIARALMHQALQHCGAAHPDSAVFLSGQQHLEAFYASLGFETQRPAYLEDGIWHVDMKRPASPE